LEPFDKPFDKLRAFFVITSQAPSEVEGLRAFLIGTLKAPSPVEGHSDNVASLTFLASDAPASPEAGHLL